MNLIRNSGFERGNTDFWERNTAGVFSASGDDVLYGAYAGKLISAMGGWDGIHMLDRVKVTPFSLVAITKAIKGVNTLESRVWAVFYDGDGQEIGYDLVEESTLDGTWQEKYFYINIPANTYYLRLQFDVQYTINGQVTYFDAMGLDQISVDALTLFAIELCSLTNRTASGDTLSTLRHLLGFKEYYGEIDVTSMTGTAPTCDVIICETDQYDNERVLGTFTQFNAITDQRIGIAAPIGKGMYVKYTMGGTVTDCDFKVSVIGVR